MSSHGLPLPVVAIFLGIGLFLTAAGLREAYRAVKIWRQRPVPIGELDRVSGDVLVSGTVERIEKTVRAPVSGQDCLAYVWRSVGLQTTYGFDGRVERSYHQLDRGTGGTRFRVRDYSGSVVVDPQGASLRLAEELIEDPVDDPTQTIRELSFDPFDGAPGTRQLYESRLDEGETVVIQGRLTAAEDPEIDIERLGVQLSGRGLYIADTTQRSAGRQATRAAVVSLSLGLVILAVLGVLLWL